MKEFALALSMLGASHHRWPMPQQQPPAAVAQPAACDRQVDRAELRRAVKAYVRRLKRGQVAAPWFGPTQGGR